MNHGDGVNPLASYRGSCMPDRGSDGRFLSGVWLVTLENGLPLTAPHVPSPAFDGAHFRAIVAEQMAKELDASRKRANNNQVAAAEDSLREVAGIMATDATTDLKAEYGSILAALRHHLRSVWHDQLVDLDATLNAPVTQADCDYPGNLAPRNEAVAILRTLTAITAGLLLHAALGIEVTEARCHVAQADYNNLCGALIARFRNKLERIVAKIDREAYDCYCQNLQTGPAHDRQQQYFEKQKQALYREAERVYADIRKHQDLFTPAKVRHWRETSAKPWTTLLPVPSPAR